VFRAAAQTRLKMMSEVEVRPRSGMTMEFTLVAVGGLLKT
jgi:hypothetical protein